MRRRGYVPADMPPGSGFPSVGSRYNIFNAWASKPVVENYKNNQTVDDKDEVGSSWMMHWLAVSFGVIHFFSTVPAKLIPLLLSTAMWWTFLLSHFAHELFGLRWIILPFRRLRMVINNLWSLVLA